MGVSARHVELTYRQRKENLSKAFVERAGRAGEPKKKDARPANLEQSFRGALARVFPAVAEDPTYSRTERRFSAIILKRLSTPIFFQSRKVLGHRSDPKPDNAL